MRRVKRSGGQSRRLLEPVTLVGLLWIGGMVLLPVAIVFGRALAGGIDSFGAALTRKDTLHAFRLTALLALAAVPANTLFGLACGLLLARGRFRGKAVLQALVDLPISISPVVAGLLILLVLGRAGWLGPWLAGHGIRVLFAFPSMLVATIFVSLPLVARELVPALEGSGREQEEAARMLGASSWQTFRMVTLPSVRLALLFGVLQCAARCIGEFGAVSVVSGRVLGRTMTVPLEIESLYTGFRTQEAFSLAVPLLSLALVSLTVQALLRRSAEAARRPVPPEKEPSATGTGVAVRVPGARRLETGSVRGEESA